MSLIPVPAFEGPTVTIDLRLVLRRYLTSLAGVALIVEASVPNVRSMNRIDQDIKLVASERGITLTPDMFGRIQKIMSDFLVETAATLKAVLKLVEIGKDVPVTFLSYVDDVWRVNHARHRLELNERLHSGRPPAGFLNRFPDRRIGRVFTVVRDPPGKLPAPLVRRESMSPKHQHSVIVVNRSDQDDGP